MNLNAIEEEHVCTHILMGMCMLHPAPCCPIPRCAAWCGVLTRKRCWCAMVLGVSVPRCAPASTWARPDQYQADCRAARTPLGGGDTDIGWWFPRSTEDGDEWVHPDGSSWSWVWVQLRMVASEAGVLCWGRHHGPVQAPPPPPARAAARRGAPPHLSQHQGESNKRGTF